MYYLMNIEVLLRSFQDSSSFDVIFQRVSWFFMMAVFLHVKVMWLYGANAESF
jgi:hypothetical protein